jgi:hypothetical protein
MKGPGMWNSFRTHARTGITAEVITYPGGGGDAGMAAGGQVLAGDDLLVDDVPAGVAHIGAEPTGLPVSLV